MEEYDYFMIRVRRPTLGAPQDTVSGMVERLGTGEKRSFESGEELLRLVGSGPGRAAVPANMQIHTGSGNT